MTNHSPNLRPPCGFTSYDVAANIIWLGSCNQANLTGSKATVYTNVTKVPNTTSSGVPPIDPYPRPYEANSQPQCSPYATVDGSGSFVCGDGINNNPYCEIPPPSDVDVTPTTTNIHSGAYQNSFTLSSASVVTVPSCSNAAGFKAVYAKKRWQGIYGYLADNRMLPSTIDWCCSCQEYPANYTLDSTKYLGVIANATYDVEFYSAHGEDPTTQSYSGTGSSTVEINKFGIPVTTTCASSSNFEGLDAYTYGFVGYATPGSVTALSAFCSGIDAATEEFFVPDTVTGSGGSWTVTYGSASSGGNGPTYIISCDLPTSATIKTYGYLYYPPGTFTPEWGQIGQTTVNISNNSFTYEAWTYYWLCTNDGGNTKLSVTGSLYNPYTSDDVIADLNVLMSSSYWDLGNDAVYPWRTDFGVNTGPLMSYAEDFGQSIIFPACTSSTGNNYNGAVKGAPMPAGYDRYWDPEHINWELCTYTDDVGETCYVRYPQTVGAWSTDCNVPCATQWTDINDSVNLPQGAFMGANFFRLLSSNCGSGTYALIQDDTLWACKYAELLISKPSFNYCRPCGIDRLQPLPTASYCVSSASGSSVYTQVSASLLSPSSSVLIYGVDSNHDGVWTVGGVSGTTVTLGAQLASASQFPSIPIPDSGTGVISKLRWFDSPGICGRIAITSASATDPVTASFDTPCYLAAGDNIIVTGSRGMSLDGTRTIQTVIDSTTVVLSATFGSSQSYVPGSAQAWSSGATDWQWNDVSSKNDFTCKVWTQNFRDFGEYNRLAALSASFAGESNCAGNASCSIASMPDDPRPYQSACGLPQQVTDITCYQSCLPYNLCKPNVVFWSPSAEPMLTASYQTYTTDWQTVTIDDRYTTMWNAVLTQVDIDYLWQPPPCPCDNVPDGTGSSYQCNCDWIQDDGSCHEDNPDAEPRCQQFYPHALLVESRCSPPDGAPTVVNPYIGCANSGDYLSGSCPAKPVCPPPQNTGALDAFEFSAVIPYTPYYQIWSTMLNCICDSGRFADIYSQQQAILCPEIPI